MRVNTTERLSGVKPTISGVLRSPAGMSIQLTDRDFKTDTLTFDHAIGNPGEVTVGGLFTGACNFSLWNDTGKFNGFGWTNSWVDITLTVKNVNVFMGSYIVSDHKSSGKLINVETLDATEATDHRQLHEAGLTFPIDAVEAIEKLVSLCLTNVQVTGLEAMRGIVSLPDPGNPTMSCREAIRHIAQILGCYGKMASDGSLRFVVYRIEDDGLQDAGTTFSHDLETDDVTITGVKTYSYDGKKEAMNGSGSGYVLTIRGNPFITSDNAEQIAGQIGLNVNGLRFRPGSFSLPATPNIEAGESIWLSTGEERCIRTIISHLTYKHGSAQMHGEAYADDGTGDIRITPAEYVKKIIDEELNNPSSPLHNAIKDAAEAGGGAGGGGDYGWSNITVDEAYEKLRPDYWPPMPEPGANEIYLLQDAPTFDTMPVGFYAGVSGIVDDQGNKNYGTMKMDWWNADGGAWKHAGSYEDTDNGPNKVLKGEMPGGVTLIKISATNPITRFGSGSYSDDNGNTIDKRGWDIVEMSARLPHVEYLYTGDFTELMFISLYQIGNMTRSPSLPASITVIKEWTLVRNEGVDFTGPVSANLFKGKTNLVAARIRGIDRSPITDYMFSGCTSLVVAEMDYDAITSATHMFSECRSLPGIGGLSMMKCTDASYMFQNCTKLRSFDTIEVAPNANMACMFYACEGLVHAGTITAETPESMSSMFGACSALENVPELTGFGLDSSYMFSGCYSLASVGDLQLDTATGTNSMFADCYMLYSVGNIHFGAAVNASTMFQNCYHLLNVGSIASIDAVTFDRMFDRCLRLENVGDIIGGAGTMSSMFGGNVRLRNIGSLDLSLANSTDTMFSGCVDLEGVGNILLKDNVNAYRMFDQCTHLKTCGTITVNGVASSMAGMFNNCYDLETFGGVIGGAKTMESMFSRCKDLVNVGNIETRYTTDVRYMFKETAITRNPITYTGAAAMLSDMFYGCSRLVDAGTVDTTGLTNHNNGDPFGGNVPKLGRLLIAGKQVSIDISKSSMGHAALVAFINSLPAGDNSARLRIGGNPGFLELTDEEKKIATDKGYIFG